jgi:hypothetical protein
MENLQRAAKRLLARETGKPISAPTRGQRLITSLAICDAQGGITGPVTILPLATVRDSGGDVVISACASRNRGGTCTGSGDGEQ